MRLGAPIFCPVRCVSNNFRFGLWSMAHRTEPELESLNPHLEGNLDIEMNFEDMYKLKVQGRLVILFWKWLLNRMSKVKSVLFWPEREWRLLYWSLIKVYLWDLIWSKTLDIDLYPVTREIYLNFQVLLLLWKLFKEFENYRFLGFNWLVNRFLPVFGENRLDHRVPEIEAVQNIYTLGGF